jgi:hypothetical protein
MENKENNMENFKRELKQLLEKYSATIGFNCGPASDTHGLYDEHMYIRIGEETKKICWDWRFNHRDLDINL